jgi:ribosome recycling factor
MPADEICFEAEEKMEKAVDHLHEEFKGVRTGRASTGLVEHLRVNYYGAQTPLNQLAHITTPDPQLIVIKPYDPSSVKEIEKAILASQIGITPAVDRNVVRLAVPPLSGERRKQLAAQVKEMAEQVKISIRNIRRDANKHVDREEKDSIMTEDEAVQAKEEIQKLTDKYEERAEELLKKKTAEIMEV